LKSINLETINFEVKIADLGLAREMDEISEDLASTICGTPI
jgi:serine/threonine protein kinase